MRNIVLCCALLALFAGCDRKPSLVGKWRPVGVSREDAGRSKDLEFFADGKVCGLRTGKITQLDQWKLSGDEIEITTDIPTAYLNDKKIQDAKTISLKVPVHFLDANHIDLTIPVGRSHTEEIRLERILLPPLQ